MKIGDMVREREPDPEWKQYPGEIGIVLSLAEDFEREAGIEGTNQHWNILWRDIIIVMFWDEVEVINENR
jgi:hypothetical protein